MIRESLKYMNLSQREFAELIDYDEATVSKWVNGREVVPVLVDLYLNLLVRVRALAVPTRD